MFLVKYIHFYHVSIAKGANISWDFPFMVYGYRKKIKIQKRRIVIKRGVIFWKTLYLPRQMGQHWFLASMGRAHSKAGHFPAEKHWICPSSHRQLWQEPTCIGQTSKKESIHKYLLFTFSTKNGALQDSFHLLSSCLSLYCKVYLPSIAIQICFDGIIWKTIFIGCFQTRYGMIFTATIIIILNILIVGRGTLETAVNQLGTSAGRRWTIRCSTKDLSRMTCTRETRAERPSITFNSFLSIRWEADGNVHMSEGDGRFLD